MVLAAATLGATSATAERLFPSTYVPLPTGSTIHHVDIADVTGDGAADIVYVGYSVDNYYDAYPRIGSFLGPPQEGVLSRGTVVAFDVGEARGMAVTDLNGDGRADVVAIVEEYYTTETLWVGLGQQGGLSPQAAIPLAGRPMSIAADDLDIDGRADIAVAPMYADSISIFRGTGDGGFVPAPGIAIHSPLIVAAGDLNDDGRPDIVVVDTGGSIHSFLSDGTGGFGRQWSVYVGGLLELIEIADVNGDGRVDLLVSGSVMLGDGTGSFGPRMSHGVNGPFAVGEFNADGRPDLAVLSGAGLYVLAGRGDGTFTASASYQVSGSDVAVGDLDENGHLDLTVAGGRTIRNLYGNGDGTFGQEIPSFPVGRFPVALAPGDLNGDHRVDLAVANQQSSSVSILMGGPGGTFVSGQDLTTGLVPSDVALADFDHDGTLDLAVAELGPRTVSVFPGRGNGTFGTKTTIPIVTGGPTSLETGDFDEDGFPDLVVSDGALSVLVLFGDSSGIQVSGRLVRVGFTEEGHKLAVADITGDGHLDIVLQGHDVAYAPGLGDGSFGPLEFEPGPDYGYFYSLATIDLCNNCNRQVLAAQYCCVTINGGDERWLGPVFGAGCSGLGGDQDAGGAMAVGDLNGDGVDDLATPLAGMTVRLGNGHGWFGSRQDFGVPGGPPAIADVNGDGKLDILVLNAVRDNVLVLLNQASRPSVPDTPDHVAAHSGNASIEVSWDPVMHPDLAGYRVRYESRSGEVPAGTGATEPISPINVPVSHTALTLHCLPESTFTVQVTAVDRWGRESECAPLVSAQPGPAGGDFSFVGGSLNAASHGRWAKGLVQLGSGVSAADIIPGTVFVNGVGPVEHMGVTDRDHDGRKELMIRFARSAVQGVGSPVHVDGRVAGCRDTLRFSVDDSVRIRRPGARPAEGTPQDADGTVAVVTSFALHPAVPSPTSTGCTIAFDLPRPEPVRLSVYDLGGRLMTSVLERDMPAGAHRLWWDRQALADGVYFVRIEAGSFRAVRRLVLLH